MPTASRQPPLQHLPPRPDESFHVVELSGDTTGCSWHFHPQYQLGLVISGEGQRIVGDSLCPIEQGEVILLGSNLPHVWRYEAGAEVAKAIVVHFSDDFAGTDFLNRPEMHEIRLLLARSSQGLQAHGATRDRAAAILRGIPDQSGFDRVLALLEVLNELARAEGLSRISNASFGVGSSVDLERLRCVYAYIDANLHDLVTREEVAAVAHLNQNAFSRFFSQHTGLTFQDYLTERRIGRACEHLMDISRSITEVALDCGFTTPTSFTRAFRRVKGMTPSQYRVRIARVLG